MSLSLARLQRLKAQAGGPAPTAASVGAPVAASNETSVEMLRRLLRVRPATPTIRAGAAEGELPGVEIAPAVRFVQRMLPIDMPALLDGAFDRRDAIDTQRLLFFDTETTGLAGGTGTRAFMIGAADCHAGQLRIRQLYLTAMSGERAMLELFRDWLDPDTVLTSYNGKSYDAPLLATRYRLCRMDNPLAGLAHVDLLYPTRRRYRGVWENCRLATIERQLLQIVREDDLPGSQAPAAWLHYLRGGSSRNLCRVLQHNDQDVVTLARLLVQLATTYPTLALAGPDSFAAGTT
ncbi:MAG TPA: ribonuclease H-like domain-containing protein [Pseudoxanthomonas sp.]|nr:ribonuclease H-like domain-containing protein [Pseudoxanthomonas sp.]